MAEQHLATYLNDHLAGSVVALEMLDHLEKTHASTPLAARFASLRAEIQADRAELESLMGRLQVSASVPRRAMAWLTEKFARLKLRVDDPEGGPLRLLEAVEAVSLGIEGKRLLWLALAAAATSNPAPQPMDS